MVIRRWPFWYSKHQPFVGICQTIHVWNSYIDMYPMSSDPNVGNYSNRWSVSVCSFTCFIQPEGPEELREICAFDSALERRSGLQHAFLGKFAYFRTIGQTRGRQWSQVVLKQHPTPDDATETPDEGTETPDGSPIVGSTRHALQLNGVLQKRWRCEVHRWRDQQLVVCRGPPEEAIDESGAFRQTQAVRFPEIDSFETLMLKVGERLVVQKLTKTKYSS